jgi:hypothetical protein
VIVQLHAEQPLHLVGLRARGVVGALLPDNAVERQRA